MLKKLSMLIPVLCLASLLAFAATGRVAASPEERSGADAAVKELQARIGKLETQVAALQAQIRQLESKAASKVLTLPGTQVFPNNQVPPGARQHEIGGIKYWVVPLHESK